MLFGIVGTASAYDVNMQIMVNRNLIQTGPSPNYYPGDKYDLTYTFAPQDIWSWTNTLNINISGKYADAKKWYAYGNSNEQAAWLRIPIIFDSVDPADFPTVNSKTTQWFDSKDKIIQAGTMVSINGVMYPVGVIKGHTPYANDATRFKYNPFWTDPSDTGAPTNPVPAGSTNKDALGIMYPIRLISGGNSETLNISYTPNGVEVYKATININFYDTATANNAVVAREVGDNAPYFNAKYSGGDTMAFDTVLKSGSMIVKNEKYYYRDTASGGDLYDDSDSTSDRAIYQAFYNIVNSGTFYADKAYVEFPTIKMEAKVKLIDKNGNALPVRTQIKGDVGSKELGKGNGLQYGHYTNMVDTIVGATKTEDIQSVATLSELFLFRSADVYETTFSAATKTDDGFYLELDANGEYTVTVRVIDNSSSLYKAYLDQFVTVALGVTSYSKYTIRPYFVPLENLESSTLLAPTASAVTIEGVKNRVNYKYLGDVTQDVYTYNAYDRQFLKYNINLNSMDRIQAASFVIGGNSSDNLPIGSTRQLTALTGHNGSIITDRQVNWKSSNPAVATVNASSGLVTAVAPGTTYITASYAVGEGYDTVAVTVGDPAPVVTVPPVVTTQYFVMVGSRSSLNVRSGPSTKDSRVGQFKRGDVVNVYEIVNGWAKIDYNGGVAYVSSRYISQ